MAVAARLDLITEELLRDLIPVAARIILPQVVTEMVINGN